MDFIGYGLIISAALVLIGLSAYILASNFFADEEQFKTSEQLEEADAANVLVIQQKAGILLRYSRPFIKRYFVPVVMSMKGKKNFRDRYRRPLASAGLTDVLNPDDFYAFKLFLIIAFPILYLVVREAGEMYDWPLAAAPAMGVVGFFYPDLWIRGKIENRQKELLLNLPFAVDMLALSVEAGLDFIAAMSKVVDKARPTALSEEFRSIIKEIRIGASRAEALRNFSWRADMIEVSSFTATLIAADSVGASIGPILKVLSVDLRQKRSAIAEKKGAQAATKLLFPMIGLIVPAVFLVVFTPLVVEYLSGSK